MDVASAPARPRSPDRIDWEQVRLLFAANWRVWMNRISQRPALLVVNGIFLVMMSGFAIGGGAFLAYRVSQSPPELARAAVHLVFLGVFFVIVVTPVLGFRGNEFLDVTKLFTFPVGHRTVFAATLCGLMGSGAVMFFAVPLFAVVIGYGGSFGAIALGLVAALLLILVAVALGQFLLLAFLNTLKSRKWRDLTMVLVPLVVGGVYVTFTIMQRNGSSSDRPFESAVEWFSGWMHWTLPLPSYWAAKAATGAGWPTLLPLAALVAVIVWLVRASAVLQEKAYFGEVADRQEVASVSRRGLLTRIASHIGGPLGALVEKELAILRREPAVRSILIGQAMYPVMWGGLGLWRVVTGTSPEQLARLVPFAGLVAYPLLLMELGLVMNLLGLEGGGAVHALLLPVKRRLLLLGKDVAYLLVFGTLNALVAVVATVAAQFVTQGGAVSSCITWCLLGALEGYCVVAIGLGIGNMMSVINPIRVAVRDRRAIRQQVGGRDGCLRNLIGVMAVFGSLALAAPVAALFHLPYALSEVPEFRRLTSGGPPDWNLLVTIPVAVAFSFGVMMLGAVVGGSLLQAREEDIVARLTKSDE